MNKQRQLFNQVNAIKLNRNNQNWLDLLTNNSEDAETFEAKFNLKGDMNDVMNFRHYLLEDKGRGQAVTAQELTELIVSNSRKELINTLQELFLEPIADANEFKYYLEAYSAGLTAEILLRLHSEDKGLRFASLIIAWKILLKQSNRKVA